MKKENLKIILEIDKLGDFDLEVINGNGKNCLQASQKLESVLGIVSNRKFKPEYRLVRQTNKTQLRN